MERTGFNLRGVVMPTGMLSYELIRSQFPVTTKWSKVCADWPWSVEQSKTFVREGKRLNREIMAKPPVSVSITPF